MTEPDSRVLKVVLTGARLTATSENELSARLQAKFKLTPEQSADLLKGRRVVKRGIDGVSATKLANALRGLGLEAVIEESKRAQKSEAAGQASAAAVAASPATIAAGSQPASAAAESAA